jgi:hypothetical protein
MQIILSYFLLSILITFFILYLSNPEHQVILKYPNYDQPISELYIDDNNVCYRYHTKQVDCEELNIQQK